MYKDTNKLRVAMLIQGYYPLVGGAERQLGAIAPLLQDLGVDVHVITRRYQDLEAYEVINGIPVHRLPIPGPKITASLSYTFHTLRLLRKLQPDAIHAHELLSPVTTAILAKRLLGIPVVAKVLRGGSLGDLARLRQKSGGQRRIRMIAQHIDGFAVISHEIDEELATIGVESSRRHFIPNGVDTDRFHTISEQNKSQLRETLNVPDVPTAIFTGRLAPEKRVDLLVSVWDKVRKQIPDAQLLILGEGQEETPLKEAAGDGVRFVGRVDDVVPYLHCADVFVLPSVAEGLSNAMLEAMATGLPPIVTRVGGAVDLVEHNVNGWLIDDEQNLIEGLVTLLSDGDLRQKMGAISRQKVMDNYRLTLTAERLKTLYEALAAD